MGARAVVATAAVMLTAACGGAGTAGPAGQVTVRVAAAASVQYALDELVDGFEAAQPEVRVEVSYGSSGALVQQLTNGAPYDLFLSADTSYPEQLVGEGVAEAADVFPYATGRLVVWAGDGSPVDPAGGIQALAGAERIAIANPAHAPYGEAAVAAMRAAGVYDQLADRLVLGENIAQAAQFVADGNAEAGIVALSVVRSPPLQGVGTWQEVPPELYPPLEHAGVLLTDPARELRDYLTGPAAAEVLARYGFRAPER